MITCKDVSFTYESSSEVSRQANATTDNGVLSHINLEIEKGQVVLLCGASGCGKTTLTRLINGLIPHYYEGKLTGEVRVHSKNVVETELYDISEVVGSVFQNPKSQFFSVDTTGELVFGCENQGMAKEEILARKEKVVEQYQLENLMGRSIFNLSGGQKQRIACAGVAMAAPEVVVLDEPSSNLDIDGILMLKNVLTQWKKEGKTIVIAEHRLWFLKDLADQVIYLADGEIKERWKGSEFFSQEMEFYHIRGLRSVEYREPKLKGVPNNCQLMILENVACRYNKEQVALEIPRLEIPMGQIIAVVGHNGAGKSTFVQCMCGLLKRDKSVLTVGDEKYKGKKRINLCYPVMQDVNHQLFAESVLDEVLLSMEDENLEKAEKYLAEMDILQFKDEHPMSLSGGQKQRVAIAGALASERDIMIFDEPTSGLDYGHMEQVARSIKYLKEKGKTVLIVTHDAEFIQVCCDGVIRLEHGHVEEN